MQLGAQIFTVMKYTKNLDDFAESLKKIANIGYKTVQVSGTCQYEGEWLNEQLKTNGLKCVLTHYPADKMIEDTDGTVALHKKFDCPRIGIGYYDFANKGIGEFKEKFLPVAKNFKEKGCKLYYHNHFQEFRRDGDKVLMEKICEIFPKDLMGITFDTYWAQKAGADPALWIEKLKGWLSCVHFKDMDFEGKTVVVGEGNMNFDRIISACEKSGSEYLLVEQDDCNGENPFDCLKRSYEYLHSLGLE